MGRLFDEAFTFARPTTAPVRNVDGAVIAAAINTLIAQHQAGTLLRFRPNDPRFARFERRELTRHLAARLDALVA